MCLFESMVCIRTATAYDLGLVCAISSTLFIFYWISGTLLTLLWLCSAVSYRGLEVFKGSFRRLNERLRSAALV